MRKKTEEMQKKSKVELNKDVQATLEEVRKMVAESRVNPQKDSNLVHKKKKHIARLKTIISSIKE